MLFSNSTCMLIRTNLSASRWQPMNEASCKYELVDVIRARLGIYEVRVVPEA